MDTFIHAARPVVFDSLGLILFAVMIALKVDLAIAAAVGVIIALAVVGWELARRRPVETLQWMSLGLVLVSAGAALVTKDPRFVMVKPTVIYAVVGACMLRRGWMKRYMPPAAEDLVDDVTIAFGYVWAGLMFVTGTANLIVAVAFTAAWPGFIAIVPLASKVGLFLIQFFVTRAVAITRSRRVKAPGAAG
jgi:intracellular septation protein A